jgi:predicted metal-binding protein
MHEAHRDVVIHVCVTCRREGDDPSAPRSGARLAEALEQALPDAVTLAPVECLGNCKRGCSIALSSPDGWTYVFGDLAPGSASDIVLAADLLAASADGLMPWRGRPEPFKRGMIARIPPHPMKDAAE